MKEILPEVEAWRESGEKVVVATVVATRRSAPRPGRHEPRRLRVREDVRLGLGRLRRERRLRQRHGGWRCRRRRSRAAARDRAAHLRSERLAWADRARRRSRRRDDRRETTFSPASSRLDLGQDLLHAASSFRCRRADRTPRDSSDYGRAGTGRRTAAPRACPPRAVVLRVALQRVDPHDGVGRPRERAISAPDGPGSWRSQPSETTTRPRRASAPGGHRRR